MIINSNNNLFIAQEIEKLVKTHDLEYIDACLLFCEKNDIEIEYFASILQKDLNLKSKIQLEAEQLNYLKKQEERLPFTVD